MASTPDPHPDSPPAPAPDEHPDTPVQVEIGGRKGPDPVRFGDWEKNGIAVDF